MYLFKFTQTISSDADIKTVFADAGTILHCDLLYSFFVNKVNDDTFIVNYRVSDANEYNCIKVFDALTTIMNAIRSSLPDDKGTICIGQPSLEQMVVIYKPAVENMAYTEYYRWSKYYDLDDLKQIAYMCMTELYNKGYYVHHNLLKQTFQRRVLEEVRRHMNDPMLASFEDEFKRSVRDGDDRLTLADIVGDTSDNKDDDDIHELFDCVKEFLVYIMGPRQFEQLFKGYATCNTTQAQVDLVNKTIKTLFRQRGYTRSNFIEKYKAWRRNNGT